MSATSMERGPGVVMHVRWELSPVVQALPPAGALVDLRGALRYHGVTASHLGEILRLRTVSRYGVDVRVVSARPEADRFADS